MFAKIPGAAGGGVAGDRLRRSRNARRRQGARLRRLRRQHRLAGILRSRRQGSVERLRRRLLPRARGGGVRRPGEGDLRAAQRQRALRRAEGGQDRRPLAQFDLDHRARGDAWPAVHGDPLSRRPGISGRATSRHDLGAGARQGQDLRAEGHDHRAEPARLFQVQLDGAGTARLRHGRRGDQGAGERRPATCSPPTSRRCTPSAPSSPNPPTPSSCPT